MNERKSSLYGLQQDSADREGDFRISLLVFSATAVKCEEVDSKQI